MALLVGNNTDTTNIDSRTGSDGTIWWRLGYTAAETGTATALYAHTSQASGSLFRLSIYNSSRELLATSAEITAPASAGWVNGAISNTAITQGQTYYLAIRIASGTINISNADSNRDCSRTTSGTYPAFPDPLPASGDYQALGILAIYADGTVGSGGPTLTTPTAASITQTTATIGCTTDSATGTLYGVVTTSATAPSAAQIAAGQDHTGSAAVFAGSNASLSVGANTIAATGLTAGTAYHTHFVQDTGGATYSNVLSGSFSTLEAINSPTISAGAITNRAVDGFTVGFTTDTANGTAYYAVYTTSTARNAATAQDIVDESTTLAAAVAAGSKAVAAAEPQTFTAVAGLNPDTPYYVAVVHYGDAQA